MDYMALALSLAKLAQGEVSPNPAVGAVIVKNDQVIGQGYTQPPGSDHAEIVALKQAGDNARGATLYVTMEPCCHRGRTGPCTQAIIEAGINEVHFAMTDPNPMVCSKGQIQLEQAGIKIVVGEHASEAADINEAFVKYITKGLPFVTAKIACSIDGRIATRSGDSKWITGEPARKQVQQLRYFSDAVMTGANTIIADDPLMNVRIAVKGGIIRKQPLRIILDGLGRTPPESRIFDQSGSTLVVLGENVSDEVKKKLSDRGADLLEMPVNEGKVNLNKVLRELAHRQITNILVETGGNLLGNLVDEGLIDKMIIYMAPMIIGGEESRVAIGGVGFSKISDCPRLQRVKIENVGEDIMITGYVVR